MILAKLDNLQLCVKSSYNNSFNLDLSIFIDIEEKSIGSGSGPEFAKVPKILEAGEKKARKLPGSRILSFHVMYQIM